MSQPAKLPPTEPVPADPYPDYPSGYGLFFQAWLILFLVVVCFALVFYLLSYLPK